MRILQQAPITNHQSPKQFGPRLQLGKRSLLYWRSSTVAQSTIPNKIHASNYAVQLATVIVWMCAETIRQWPTILVCISKIDWRSLQIDVHCGHWSVPCSITAICCPVGSIREKYAQNVSFLKALTGFWTGIIVAINTYT